jgi:hypothetical protein
VTGSSALVEVYIFFIQYFADLIDLPHDQRPRLFVILQRTSECINLFVLSQCGEAFKKSRLLAWCLSKDVFMVFGIILILLLFHRLPW